MLTRSEGKWGGMLNRLTHAETAGPQWGQSYTFDGFGNLTAKTVTKGSGTSWANAADPATNRLTGQSYDANGNALLPGASYDGDNRMTARTLASGTETYQYDPSGHRVAKWTNGTTRTLEIFFYDAMGHQTNQQTCAYDGTGATAGCLWTGWPKLYFAGQLILSNGEAVVTDRLGSVAASGTSTGTMQHFAYLPYGEQQSGPALEGTVAFGTYIRDNVADSQDYANQRYYNPWMGRFNTPDPSMEGVDYANPISWNAYAYVNGDPINFNDPSGLGPVTLPPVVPGTNCSSAFINYAAQFGESTQQLFDSGTGILGVMSFFEEQGSGSSADEQLWAALDWTFLNRWSLSNAQKVQFYGSAANVPQTFAATVTTGTSRSQVFTSSGQLTAGFTTQLLNILTGDPNSKQCEGLADAFDVAQGTIDAFNFPGVDPGTFTKATGLRYITNPVPGALQFGANGAVPSYNRSVFVQSPIDTITDGSDVWVFYSDIPRPPVIRRPPRPRRPL